MERELLERIRESYVVYNDGPGVLRGDHDEFYAVLFHQDAEIVVPQSYPDMEPVYVGVDGLKRQRARMDEIWENLHWEPERFIEAGEIVVVLMTLSGMARQMQARVSASVAHVWTIRDGRVAKIEAFLDRGEAFAAAGLPEE